MTVDAESLTSGTDSFKQKIQRVKIPFFFVIFSYITASVVLFGVIGWKFTYDSATSSVNELASKIQMECSTLALNKVQASAQVIAQVTLLQREMWITNKWSSSTPETQKVTHAAMLSVLKQFRNWMIDIYYTADWNGTILQELDSFSDGNNTIGWAFGDNWLVDDYTTMHRAYTWSGKGYKSVLAIAVNPVTKERVAVGTDWELETFSHMFKNITMSIPYPIFAAGPVTAMRTFGGVNWAARVEIMDIPWDSPWLSVQYLSQDAVTESLRTSSTKTEIIIFTIMGGMVLIGTLFAWSLSRQIKTVVMQIKALKELKFQEVLDSDGVRNASFVEELGSLQMSFHEMVVVFAKHLKLRNDMSQNRGHGHMTSAASGVSGIGANAANSSITVANNKVGKTPIA
ncbi:hypothetical protein HK101_008977 [Irineochytrium annulatum]|nr:hypothetical protein HK101_008977 [Irineochytrium annulatum]